MEAPILPRPVYQELACDGELAIQNRILLPGTPLASDGGVTSAYRMIRARLQNLISNALGAEEIGGLANGVGPGFPGSPGFVGSPPSGAVALPAVALPAPSPTPVTSVTND